MALQQDLADAGDFDAKVDGVYGPETVDAVVALQRANGLPQTGTRPRRGDHLGADHPRARHRHRTALIMCYRFRFPTRARARFAVAQYIELFYNQKRHHSTLGYRTLAQAHAEHQAAAAAA